MPGSQDLHHYRAGCFETGDLVKGRLGGAEGLVHAAIGSYDDDSETYTVLRLSDGKRLHCVTDDEIEGGKYGKLGTGWWCDDAPPAQLPEMASSTLAPQPQLSGIAATQGAVRLLT